jgi:ATP-binding cassette, subfamily B, multidrug efflux pump
VNGPNPEEETLGKAYDAELMRRLLHHLRPFAGRVVLAVLLLIAGALLQVAGPWFTQRALDEAIPAGDHRLLGVLAGLYLAATLGSFILEYLQTLLTTWLGQRVMFDLRQEIFRHVQTLDLGFHARNPVGRLMTRITSDVETLNELFSSGLVSVFGDVFTLIFILSAMLLMDAELALVSFAVLPLVGGVVALFRKRIRESYREIRVRLARINTFLHERITGITVVQLFNREEADTATLDRINQDHLAAHLRSIRYYALFFPVIEFLTAVALALILWYGGMSILLDGTTVGVLAAFLQYARRFFRPIQDLSEKYNLLQGAMASSERIFRLLDERPTVADPAHPVTLPTPVRGEIEFRNVWFAYNEGETGEAEWVLRGISFRAAPGERIAIVGHTGAGKSTLIHLLLRFHDPQRGEILLDGIPLRSIRQAELRRAIALVLQDVFLFSESAAYNIRLGEAGIPDDAVRRAAQEAGAAPIIERLEQGYDHPLGERGATLSTGERQLISFARALAFDPRILVLDEATSSIDSEMEEGIQRATERLMQGRTSLVIAHRLSTIQHADRILVMHHGRIVEEGTHSGLIARAGLYARLHELQFAPGG